MDQHWLKQIKKDFNCLEVFGVTKEIKLLGNEKVYLNRYSTSSETLANTQANKHTYDNVPNYLLEAIIFVVMFNNCTGSNFWWNR